MPSPPAPMKKVKIGDGRYESSSSALSADHIRRYCVVYDPRYPTYTDGEMASSATCRPEWFDERAMGTYRVECLSIFLA